MLVDAVEVGAKALNLNRRRVLARSSTVRYRVVLPADDDSCLLQGKLVAQSSSRSLTHFRVSVAPRFVQRQGGRSPLEDVPVVLGITPCAGDFVGEPSSRSESEIFGLLSEAAILLSDLVENVVWNQSALGVDADVLRQRPPPGRRT